nr:hypothetical protein [Micromonospora sp. DSM 115978]
LPPLSWGIHHLFRIFLLLGAVALSLGLVGVYQHLRSVDDGAGFTWTNVAFFTFTLFLADATLYENLGTFPPALEVARFLAPLATAAGIADAVGSLFTAQWEARRSRLQRGHVVVCGSTTTGRAVVDKL